MTNPEISNMGTKRWHNQNGQYHRKDGPAVKWVDGSKEWWINGKSHRLDGPALEGPNGICFYFINDRELTEDEWNVHPLRKDYIIQKNLKYILND